MLNGVWYRNRNQSDLCENLDTNHRSYEILICDKGGILFQYAYRLTIHLKESWTPISHHKYKRFRRIENLKGEKNLVETIKDYIHNKGMGKTFITKIGNPETIKAMNVIRYFYKRF